VVYDYIISYNRLLLLKFDAHLPLFSFIHLPPECVQNLELNVYIFTSPFTSEGLGFLVEIEI
jgi:hypothetical protein